MPNNAKKRLNIVRRDDERDAAFSVHKSRSRTCEAVQLLKAWELTSDVAVVSLKKKTHFRKQNTDVNINSKVGEIKRRSLKVAFFPWLQALWDFSVSRLNLCRCVWNLLTKIFTNHEEQMTSQLSWAAVCFDLPLWCFDLCPVFLRDRLSRWDGVIHRDQTVDFWTDTNFQVWIYELFRDLTGQRSGCVAPLTVWQDSAEAALNKRWILLSLIWNNRCLYWSWW